MQAKLPVCSRPIAMRRLRRALASIDTLAGLVDGALAIASHEEPSTRPLQARKTLAALATAVRRSVRSDHPPAVIAHLHTKLFDEMGFDGDNVDYYAIRNSLLPAVLERRLGLPILLSLLYRAVGEMCGLKVDGIGLPGHFIVRVRCPGADMLIDPFHGGRLLSVEEARRLAMQALPADAPWNERWMEPLSNAQWLARIAQNLLHAYNNAGQYADVAAMIEMQMLLLPDQTALRRDLALVLARVGLPRPAFAWLDLYLQDHPDDPHRSDLQQLLEALSA